MTNTELNVVFIACRNTLTTSISLPMELLKAADSLSRSPRNKLTASSPLLKIQIATIDGKDVMTHTGISMSPECSLGAIEKVDIVFLPALWRNPIPVIKQNKSICKWLTKMFSRETTIIAGVGTGCCFMAEAGLLDGKFATTHWHYFDAFEKRYPKVRLQRKYFITQSERLYCTGSVNTLADLTVHFISLFYSRAISNEVERHFFHDIRGGYAKLALLEEVTRAHPDEAISDAQAYIQHHFDEQINFNHLAAKRGMSRRNFDRRFKQASGATALHYLQALRMQNAKDLLKNSNLSITEIMFKTGYHDAAHFCGLFKKHHKATPRQFRTTVRAKLFKSN